MKTIVTPYSAFVGIDRSDKKIDITVLDHEGRNLGHRQISSKPNSLQDWIIELRKQFPNGTLALCIEQPCANLAAFFSRFDFIDLLLINPATFRKWHDAFKPSKARDDATDSTGLAELAHQNYSKLTVWKPDDAKTRKLRALVEARRSLVDLRTKLNNQLVALLKNYFPQALEITGKYLHGKIACDLLAKWPTLQQIKKAKPATLRKFYYAHQSRRPDVVEDRIKLIAEAISLTDDPAILESSELHMRALIGQFNSLRASIDKFDREIEELLNSHEDSAIFKSLPGAGPNLASRLLVAFGTDRKKFETASSILDFSGISPVLRQSG